MQKRYIYRKGIYVESIYIKKTYIQKEYPYERDIYIEGFIHKRDIYNIQTI